MAKRIKVDIPRSDAINYIREGLKREGLIAPDDDADFVVNADAVNDDDVLVEVANVSVAPKGREKGVSLSELRAQSAPEEERAPREAVRPKRDAEGNRIHGEEDEDIGSIAEEIKRANRRAGPPPKPVSLSPARNASTTRVGVSLDDLGKDPADMRDEIG